MEIKNYNLDNLLQSLSIKHSEFRSSIQKLEQYKLIRIFADQEHSNTLNLFLYSPPSISTLIDRSDILKVISDKYPSFKLTEFRYCSEKSSELDEITFTGPESSSGIEIKNTSLSPQDKQLYISFYNEIYKFTGREFILSERVVEILNQYTKGGQLENSKLIKLGILSIKEKKHKHYFSMQIFSNLLHNEFSETIPHLNSQEYHAFWKNILNEQDKPTLRKKFRFLFHSYSPSAFYIHLTERSHIPSGLEKWIKDCICKNLGAEIINGTLSFVYSLLNKIPLNYLIKMSSHFLNDGIHSSDQFLDHIHNVLKYELKGKNRLGIKMEYNKEVKL